MLTHKKHRYPALIVIFINLLVIVSIVIGSAWIFDLISFEEFKATAMKTAGVFGLIFVGALILSTFNPKVERAKDPTGTPEN